MRRLTDRRSTASDTESGAVATIVAILLGAGVILGMAALTVDVGQLYAERRQVQNGADAAALAVAVSCARASVCDSAPGGQATAMAGANANDGATAVLLVCGDGSPSLTTCPGQSGPELTQCPSSPTGVTGWVRVRTATLTSGGGTLLPPAFARALAGNSGYTGSSVHACAQAAWGPPASLTTVPITLSLCEWDAATANGTTYAPAPIPPHPSSGEVALKLHATNEPGGCPSTGGAYADLPGGFGWLDSTGCQATITAEGLATADPGVSGAGCSDVVPANVGKTVFLPVYEEAWGTGSSGTYRISGFAAFYISGYNLPAAHPNHVDSPVGGRLCRGDDKCIYGWFTQGLTSGPGAIGTGPDRGANVVALTG
jgi:Flp pilus assembly protein TadG